MAVTLWQLGNAAQLAGDAAIARDAWLACGGVIAKPQQSVPQATKVVVDALLGTGLKGSVREDCAALIETVNLSGCPVIAVDVPSGLCADTGASLGAVINARQTVTFIGIKQGLCTGKGGRLYR